MSPLENTMRVYKFQGIELQLDEEDEATPAIVSCRKGGREYTATWDCATQTGFLGSGDEIELTQAQLDWLTSEANEQRVTDAFEKARAGNPDYN